MGRLWVGLAICLGLLVPPAIASAVPAPSPLRLTQAANPLVEAFRLERQGDEQLETKQYGAAIQSFRQAIGQFQAVNQPDLGFNARRGLARALLLAGDYPQAITIWQEVVRSAGPGIKEPALSSLGLAWYRLGNLVEAEKAWRQAIAGWEGRRADEFNTDLDKVTLVEQQAYTYRLLQKLLVTQGQPEAALEMAERSRARALVELLIERENPASRLTPPSLSQIRQIARQQNSTLVEYSIIGRELRVLGNEPEQEAEIFIWVVRPDGNIHFRQVPLPVGVSLKDLVLKTREQAIGVRGRGLGVVARASGRDATTATRTELADLHRLLIQPISDLLPQEPTARVTIIPQSALFLVPFAALTDPDGRYLIQNHTLLTASSIQVLDLIQRRSQAKTGWQPALVLGNPTMPRLPQGETLAPLPGAEQEAKAIADLLKTRALTGPQASKATILQLLPEARLIHLATHGLLDLDANLTEFGLPVTPPPRTARESGVRVTPGSVIVGKGVNVGGLGANVSLAQEKVVRVEMPGTIALAPAGSDPGFLSAREIASLRLQANLAVLSACDTGRGRITGDGVVGLSRAFIAAGVPSVVVSLWAIPDAPTATLMQAFYQNLSQNPDKAQALRQAMLTTQKKHPAPQEWAAFILVGSAD